MQCGTAELTLQTVGEYKVAVQDSVNWTVSCLFSPTNPSKMPNCTTLVAIGV